MRICCFTDLDELAPYADDWERLSAGVPFRTATWLWHWWRHYGPRNDADRRRTRLAVLGVFDDTGTAVGFAPWYLDCSAMHGRVLRSLGSGDVCSDYLSVLCQPETREAVLEALAEYLVRNAQDDAPDALQWDLLELDGVDAEDIDLAGLLKHLAALGATIYRRPGLNCWRINLLSSWEAYVASLGKHLRRDARRLERDLAAGRTVLHSTAQFEDMSLAMDLLVDLHQRRRKMLGEEGCFASDRFLGFYRDVVPAMFRRGQIQFHWLELDGKPVAVEYELVSNGVLYFYQTGFDPEARVYKPGKLLNLAVIKWAMAQGYQTFDFLRGDELYKANFRAQARPTIKIRVVPQRVVAQLRHNLWLAGRNMKDRVKKGMRGEWPTTDEITQQEGIKL